MNQKKATDMLQTQEPDQNWPFIEETTAAFANLIDTKDDFTNSHSFRVALYTRMLTIELGYDAETVERYYYAALLHDVGKTQIPKRILMKNGRLTKAEFQTVSKHPLKGYYALKSIQSSAPEAAEAAAFHHERPDGKGYPLGLTGDQIPRVAQIIAVADAFDAMYSDRPYRKRVNFEHVVSVIKDGAGTQFATDVVQAFLRLVQKGKLRAKNDHGDGSIEDIINCSLLQKHA